MKASLCLILLAFGFAPIEDGYHIQGEVIEFSYKGSSSQKHVYVSGNFNNWTKDGESWKMEYHPEDQQWQLRKSFKEMRAYGSFLEFTFRVDGKLIDADRKAKNVIHCAGYGYRYVIK